MKRHTRDVICKKDCVYQTVKDYFLDNNNCSLNCLWGKGGRKNKKRNATEFHFYNN